MTLQHSEGRDQKGNMKHDPEQGKKGLIQGFNAPLAESNAVGELISMIIVVLTVGTHNRWLLKGFTLNEFLSGLILDRGRKQKAKGKNMGETDVLCSDSNAVHRSVDRLVFRHSFVGGAS